MSEWPLRYFVALCRDRSKPAAVGRKLTGIAKVLSINQPGISHQRRFAPSIPANLSCKYA